MNLKKRMTLLLTMLLAIGVSTQSYSQIFRWNNYTVTETITEDCCVEITINFGYDGSPFFGNENNVVWISEQYQVTDTDFHTVSTEPIGTSGTYTYKLCPSEGQLMLDYRIRMAEDDVDLRPAYLYPIWDAPAISLLERLATANFSGCCWECDESNVGDYLDITIETNSIHCEVDECFVTAEINLPPEITCFDHYILSFGDAVRNDPIPLVDGQAPELLAGQCVSDGESIYVAVGLMNGINALDCLLDEEVGCEYTCCDEYVLCVTPVTPPLGSGYGCCYEYEMKDDFVTISCVSCKLVVQPINDPISPTYAGAGGPLTGTICAYSEPCPEGLSGLCLVSRRFVLYDEFGNYLCDKEWSNGDMCGSGGGQGGAPTGGAPVHVVEKVILGIESHGFDIHNVPNPASDQTTIHFTMNEETTVKMELFDITGRSLGIVNQSIYQKGNQSYQLNTSAYPPGTYFIRFDANGKIATHSLQIK